MKGGVPIYTGKIEKLAYGGFEDSGEDNLYQGKLIQEGLPIYVTDKLCQSDLNAWFDMRISSYDDYCKSIDFGWTGPCDDGILEVKLQCDNRGIVNIEFDESPNDEDLWIGRGSDIQGNRFITYLGSEEVLDRNMYYWNQLQAFLERPYVVHEPSQVVQNEEERALHQQEESATNFNLTASI